MREHFCLHWQHQTIKTLSLSHCQRDPPGAADQLPPLSARHLHQPHLLLLTASPVTLTCSQRPRPDCSRGEAGPAHWEEHASSGEQCRVEQTDGGQGGSASSELCIISCVHGIILPTRQVADTLTTAEALLGDLAGFESFRNDVGRGLGEELREYQREQMDQWSRQTLAAIDHPSEPLR